MRNEELWKKPRRRGFFDINRRYPNIIKERDNWDLIVVYCNIYIFIIG